MSKVILCVSFGTTDAESRESCIGAVENAFAEAFPDHRVVRAFTSTFIRRKLAGQGIVIPSPEEAAAAIRENGDEYTVASTHMIPGIEYEKLCAQMAGHAVSEPLFATDADLDEIADFLGTVQKESGRTLIVMGHGTDHASNIAYDDLRKKLPEHVYLACVEGEYTLAHTICQLDPISDHAVLLMPLMLVAGDHARNDMAGDEPDSWKSILTARGFDVKARLKGLGSEARIRAMFVRKLAKLIEA